MAMNRASSDMLYRRLPKTGLPSMLKANDKVFLPMGTGATRRRLRQDEDPVKPYSAVNSELLSWRKQKHNILKGSKCPENLALKVSFKAVANTLKILFPLLFTARHWQ